jgi:L-ribulose-5-phosphate 3-epimerase
MDIGVMFWAGRDSLDEIRSIADCGQLGISGEIELTREFTAPWKQAARSFRIVTVVCAYRGESYADIPTVQATVGFIPHATRAERERRTFAASDFAAELGVPGIACHIGMIPDDRTDSDYIAVRDMVRRISDHAASHGQTFALETGQESAEALLRFLEDTGRGNLKINFDPANMILYGSGDPIAAFETLAPHVVSVHAKDGDPPPAAFPGRLGTERPLGQGSVDIPRFIATLERAGYQGTVNIEREIDNQHQRIEDIRRAATLLRKLIGGE